MNPLNEMKSQKFHLTLTLADIDALHKAGSVVVDDLVDEEASDLIAALQKLDEAVNL